MGQAARALLSGRRSGHGRRGWTEEAFVDCDRRLLPEPIDLALGDLRSQFFLDLRTYFVKRLGFLLVDLDDVVTERRLYRLAEFAYGQRERGLLERRHHLAVLEESKIAAVGSGAGVVGLGFRFRRKIAAGHQL